MSLDQRNPCGNIHVKMTTLQPAIAARGEGIYRERYKAEYETSNKGMFVVIDVEGGRAFVADTPEGALQAAVNTLPDGKFHLIQVGAPAVFRVGYSRCGSNSGDGVFEGS